MVILAFQKPEHPLHQVMEAFVVMLIRNLPHAFQLQAVLRELHAGLILRVRQAHGSGGSSLCASEWLLGIKPAIFMEGFQNGLGIC